MAKTNDQGIPVEGGAGSYSWHYWNQESVMRKRHNVKSTKKPTEAMMVTRMQWRNLVSLWGLFNDELHPSFEPLRPGETDYSRFLSANASVSSVFLTKAMAKAGACVLPNIVLTEGSLKPSVEYHREGENVVSDIALGTLVISADTTVAQFAFAVLNNNDGRYGKNDYLGFFLGKQSININTGYPVASVKGQRVKLDLECNLKLWEVTGQAGFQTVNGYLGTPYAAMNLYAWVRLIETENNRLLVSSQRLVGENTLVDTYSTEEAFKKAADTYGGYKNKFLTPFKNKRLSDRVKLPEQSTTPTGEVTITTSVQGAGTVSGGGTYAVGTQVTLTATPADAQTAPFQRWSDGVTQNPRVVTASQNATYTAIFGASGSGGGGID